jgi:hypothetical protein
LLARHIFGLERRVKFESDLDHLVEDGSEEGSRVSNSAWKFDFVQFRGQRRGPV